MDLSKQFRTSDALETDGVWFDLDDTTKVKVARQGNKGYAKLVTREFEKNKRILDAKNDAADAKGEAIMIDVMARTILLDWEGVEWEGAPLPYSLDNAKKVLALKDFRMVISAFAQDVEAYRTESDKAAVGN